MNATRRQPRFVVALCLGALLLAPRADAQTATVIATIAGRFTTCAPPLVSCTGGADPLTEIHSQGNEDGLALLEARLRVPFGMALDAAGRLLVLDYLSSATPFPGVVRVLTPVVPATAGTVAYTAGPPLGLTPLAALYQPSVPLAGTSAASDITVTTVTTPATGAAGNWVIADRSNHQVKVFTPSGALQATFGNGIQGYVNGAAGSAEFNYPSSLALDSAGNVIVADQTNNAIRRIDAATGNVTTLAGDQSPRGSVSCAANCVAVGGFGDGPANGAGTAFHCPSGITRGASDTEFFVGDECNHRVRKVDLAANLVSTFAGSGVAGFLDGPATVARFRVPGPIDRDPSGNLYVSDTLNDKVRKVTPAGVVSTIGLNETATVDAFDVPATEAPPLTAPPSNHFDFALGIAVGRVAAAGVPVDDHVIFVSDTLNFRVREIVTVP